MHKLYEQIKHNTKSYTVCSIVQLLKMLTLPLSSYDSGWVINTSSLSIAFPMLWNENNVVPTSLSCYNSLGN